MDDATTEVMVLGGSAFSFNCTTTQQARFIDTLKAVLTESNKVEDLERITRLLQIHGMVKGVTTENLGIDKFPTVESIANNLKELREKYNASGRNVVASETWNELKTLTDFSVPGLPLSGFHSGYVGSAELSKPELSPEPSAEVEKRLFSSFGVDLATLTNAGKSATTEPLTKETLEELAGRIRPFPEKQVVTVNPSTNLDSLKPYLSSIEIITNSNVPKDHFILSNLGRFSTPLITEIDESPEPTAHEKTMAAAEHAKTLSSKANTVARHKWVKDGRKFYDPDTVHNVRVCSVCGLRSYEVSHLSSSKGQSWTKTKYVMDQQVFDKSPVCRDHI